MLSRCEDEADRRKRRLVLTEKALPIVKEGREMQASFADALKTNITDSEFDAVESVAEKLKAISLCLKVRSVNFV